MVKTQGCVIWICGVILYIKKDMFTKALHKMLKHIALMLQI